MTTCDICGEPAKFHDTRIFNGVTKTVNLCEEHAREAGFDIGSHGISINLSPESFGIGPTFSPKECPDCGMTIGSFKDAALIGCPECYATFEKQLIPVIASMQEKHTKHVGRTPRRASADIDRHIAIRRLLTQLERAVTQEEYEEAAEIRDTLRELHKGEDYEV
ncbi:UvrB/UvrC motif-containing protein [PVC group bacterium]|nr:UvrB/UvrC motif-containing protein [PVC group bacterium]